MAAGVLPLYEVMNITMKSLQSPLLVLSQQRCEVKNLVSNFCSGTGICLVAEDRSYESLEMTECFLQGRFWLKFSSNSEVIADQGSWARNLLASLPGVDQKRPLSSIARFPSNWLMDWLPCRPRVTKTTRWPAKKLHL
jgi:hypothetical protein